MFRNDISLELANQFVPGTMMETLGIEFTGFGENYLLAKMPVDHRTVQPMQVLHGGASLALAETVGSAASNLIIDHDLCFCVGMEINANHLKSATEGYVHAKAEAVHIGRRTHIWDIRIKDDNDQLVCISRLTMAVINK
jgi:1,4-dihydroxy-2-naphthoyl-CoA hydrolase